MKLLFIILSVLSAFLANLEQKTLQSDYTVTVVESNDKNPMNYPGSLTMHGQQFLLSMVDLQAAYDGKTMYMYSKQTDELTLSNPTEQELLEANPFLYAKALVKVCDITEQDKDEQTLITLVPKDQSVGISKFILYVRNSDLMPLRIRIKEGQQFTTFALKNPHFITSELKFTLEPQQTTFVNDMRY